ncbi:hypothetical protein [Arthrobacter sp. FW306-04-A]|jgi:hypothetical protein|uniref:hypothetical protein n=1 Tax=Arthrobacter sp. FW306-04-A TaxID=2879619 RepID=UPI0037C0D675|nr:hypothetical protein LFT43_06705 [Arthrobacter sp. FW306-04-A]
MSATEFMAQLQKDQEYQSKKAAFDAEHQARVSLFRKAEQPIVEDLRGVGLDVKSVWDLVNTADPYPAALPVLFEHLERGGYPDRVLEGLGRALAVKPAQIYWPRLRELYLRATGPDEEQGLAVALAASATPENLNALLDLLNETTRGSSRILFLSTIVRVGGDIGRNAVESLRNDPLFGKEARALLKQRS